MFIFIKYNLKYKICLREVFTFTKVFSFSLTPDTTEIKEKIPVMFSVVKTSHWCSCSQMYLFKLTDRQSCVDIHKCIRVLC